MPIEQIVLELVLVATQTPVARTIAVVRALFQKRQRILEECQAEILYSLRKPSAARQGVVNVYFGLAPFTTGSGQRGPILGLQFMGFQFQPRACRLGEGLADRAK